MRYITSIFIGVISCFFLGCTGTESPSRSNAVSDLTATDSSIAVPAEYTNASLTPPSHQCNIPGEILEHNQSWLKNKQLLVCIKADSTTMDADLNVKSHRILELYNTESCERIDSHTLPVNVSPDFPYYLAKISYNLQSRLIAIRGFNSIFIYDIDSRKLSVALEPQYKEERFASDAQSGRILRIELWEDYLIGFAQEYGAFAFHLDQKNQMVAALPFAEWLTPEEKFTSLFLLSSQEGGQQAFIPEYDFEKDAFNINSIFDKPQELNTENAKGTQNSRFVVFRGNRDNGSAITIDLAEKKLVDLPQNIASGNNQTILNWLQQHK